MWLRVFGKREIAQLNPFDLVVLLSPSNTIVGNDNSLIGGLVGALSLLLINYLVVRFLFRHRRLDELFEGPPAVLVENGKVQEKALAAELLPHAELATMPHRQGFDSVNEVETCVLEPGGTFSVKRKEPRAEDVQWRELAAQLKTIGGKLDLLIEQGRTR